MKKQFLVIVSLLVVAAMLAACGGNSGGGNNTPNNTPNNSGAAEGNAGGDSNEETRRAVLVLPEEIGVNPFFQLMDEGFKRGGEEFGLEVRTIESSDPAAFEQNLRAAVAENYDLIVTATFQAEDALNKVAQENPDKTFAIIDTFVDLPNVRSVGFREYEAAYLMGAAAGLSTQTNTVGAIVAMDTPLLKKYTGGFEQGLQATNPEAKFLVNYVGGFNDPAQAKELALQQHSQGADFIAGMAAVGDNGVFEAASEEGFYTAGQDTDRTVLDPEHIVLSQLKGTDAVAYETVKSFAEDNFTFEAVEYGLEEGGVGITFVTHESESELSDFIGQETIDQLKEMAEQIKSGELVVANPLAQ
ncbi:BMP family lipoprotein [Paenibacillus daejeonensis]|uniref:BMP family lipoprotein n=1 Tax=Paenibacillus daejeonensis TaxID=135193 RepID=UPI0003774024|nr:BMP family protein [Paenibacillus daejeonensis]